MKHGEVRRQEKVEDMKSSGWEDGNISYSGASPLPFLPVYASHLSRFLFLIVAESTETLFLRRGSQVAHSACEDKAGAWG